MNKVVATIAVVFIWAGSAWAQHSTVVFQQGSNGYTSATDTYIATGAPDRNHEGKFEFEWDGQDGGGANYALMRFGDIFGDEPGQIPPGVPIIEAEITTIVSNTGGCNHTSIVYGMIRSWDAETVTYRSLFGDVDPGSGIEPGMHVGLRGTEITHDPCQVGRTFTIPITDIVQEWSDGSPNYGFIIIPNEGSTNGFGHQAAEFGGFGGAPSPVLEVETTQGTYLFQNGREGYNSGRDTWVGNNQDEFITNYGDDDTIYLQAPNQEDFAFGMIRFDDIIGPGASQIPPDAVVINAILRVGVINEGNSPVLVQEIQPWESAFVNTYFDEMTVTFENFVENGFFPEPGVEIGMEPIGQFDPDSGVHEIDVTASLGKYLIDPSTNYGWILEPTSGNDVEIAAGEWESTAPALSITFEGSPVGIEDFILY